jgi:ribosomal protein L14
VRLLSGEVIKVSLQEAANKNNLLSKKIYHALIVSTRWPTRRVGGHYIKFDSTRAVLLEDGEKFLGTSPPSSLCSVGEGVG